MSEHDTHDQDSKRALPGASELLIRARDGDLEAFDQLFATVSERLLVFLRAQMGRDLLSRFDPVDLLQDVYLSSSRSVVDFEPRGNGSFQGWICAIARNRIRRLLRDERVRPLRGASGGFARMCEIRVATGTGPLTAAGRVDARDRIAEALAQLPAIPRQVLLAHYFEGLSLAEIARVEGRSPSAVQRDHAIGIARVGRLLRTLEDMG